MQVQSSFDKGRSPALRADEERLYRFITLTLSLSKGEGRHPWLVHGPLVRTAGLAQN